MIIAIVTRKDRTTVTLDPELLTGVKNRVGERGVSGYLNRMLGRQLQHDAMSEYLAERERQRGPIPEDVVRRVASLIDNAHEPVNRARVQLRLERALGTEHVSPKLADIVAAAKRAHLRLETILGKRAGIEIDGDEIRIVDAEPIPALESEWS
jgi:hypothetical protein